MSEPLCMHCGQVSYFRSHIPGLGKTHEFEPMPTHDPTSEYDRGFMDALRCFAHWKCGVVYVGTTGRTLADAIEKRKSLHGYNE
jgi:hypothetical protein